jgi:hypothetical protein
MRITFTIIIIPLIWMMGCRAPRKEETRVSRQLPSEGQVQNPAWISTRYGVKVDNVFVDHMTLENGGRLMSVLFGKRGGVPRTHLDLYLLDNNGGCILLKHDVARFPVIAVSAEFQGRTQFIKVERRDFKKNQRRSYSYQFTDTATIERSMSEFISDL